MRLHRVTQPVPSVNSRRDDATVALSGFTISFLGSLPLGTVNLLQVQLAASDGINAALWFSAGCFLAEFIYVSISLATRNLFTESGIVVRLLRWVPVAFLAGLAITSVTAATNELPSLFLPRGGYSLFIFGFLLVAINPVSIPFWVGWNTVLFERKILMPTSVSYALYIFGIALGTMAADILFILTGHFLLRWFPGWQTIFHLVIGGIYAVTALYLAWGNLKRLRDLPAA